jgi:hypothetical protein
MFLPEHGYIVEKVGSVEKTRSEKNQFIECVFRKPAPKDEFGESKFADDIYQVKAWDTRMNLVENLSKGDKVKAQLSLRGSETFDQQNTKIYYNMDLSVMKLEKLP